jgi:SAM-dependent methyltransferase
MPTLPPPPSSSAPEPSAPEPSAPEPSAPEPSAPEPSPPAFPPGAESHQAREVAESFGAEAGRYDRARPSYPGALVERIVAASPGRGVLDVGCGTGIVARLFQAAGCEVLGVDPDARMAGRARERGLAVEVATFETWQPNGRAFDMVVSGQAWHWVDPVAGAAKSASALRPGGRLAVFWNVFLPPADLGQAIAQAYRLVLPDLPSDLWERPLLGIYETMGAKAADGMRQAGAFGPPEQWQFEWERPYTRDEWLEQVPTFGGFSRIPPDQQEQILAGIGTAIDAAGGRFTMGFTTLAVTAALAAPPLAGPR